MQPLTTHTQQLSEDQILRLQAYLSDRDYESRRVPHARFSVMGDQFNVTVYESGKLVVQGKGTRDFVEFVLEPEILKRAGLGYETELDPELAIPRIGIDESGKGDFFGPLCVAGVYANEEIVRRWLELGIRDSKKIKSRQRIREFADLVRAEVGSGCEVVTIGNEAYNRLHRKMGNVNAMLAWGHARVLESLMERASELDPVPRRAVSDQFARSEATIRDALMAKGREVELIQRHRAEEDPVVAAASILAREAFLKGMDRLEREYEVSLPRGAGEEVDRSIELLVERHGGEVLERVGKVHFRNALRHN